VLGGHKLTWLITGGAGYIGRHIALNFFQNNLQHLIIDDFSTGEISKLPEGSQVLEGSILDKVFMEAVFTDYEFEGVIHLAARKSVAESVLNPDLYARINTEATDYLFKLCQRYGVKNFIFSSSAAVYADSNLARTEKSPVLPLNPYGKSKLDAEELIISSNTQFPINVVIFRFFNVTGAASKETLETSGTNLIPAILKAIEENSKVTVYGSGYDTIDGTCVRDYIHVVDLAQGHLAALNYLQHKDQSITVNLGTGKGVSVKEMADTFAKVNGVPLPYKYVDRRPGDVPEYYADTQLAEQELGWKAKLDVARMCQDSLRWQSQNPNGY
jgi:UDP-glucose 4-epimerase